ncbi:DUF460 domain-containing protein [Halorutilales archaeon Cl-col2-1]
MKTRTGVLDTVVFGVDVQSGDVRGDSPSYAVVAFDGENIDRDVVSHRKLLRLIQREEPDIVATDNMYEVAEDKKDLVGFLRNLPSETRLVQVTGDERPEPLSRVAARHGVPYGKKPIKEAEAAARLAADNVGYVVSAFEDTTRLKVSRGRSTGKGGWSQDRYTRRIHGAVRRRSRGIEEKLDNEGFEYDLDVTEKYGGYSNAVFTVEARAGEVPVSSERSGDVRVEVEEVRKDGIEFEPLARRRDYVIVGMDPGTTTAVGVVGLDGEILNVVSTRTSDISEIIEWIVERGRPVVVAADVTPMPDTVEKVRRSFDAAGWKPDEDLRVNHKQRVTSEYSYDNDHERDAVAAALFAFDEYDERFERISRKVPPGLEDGEVIRRVVAYEESVETAIDVLTETEDEDDEDGGHSPRELTEDERRIKDLEKQVERLKSYVDDLEGTVEEKNDEIDELQERLSERRREEKKEIRKTDEVRRLEKKNQRLEHKLTSVEEKYDDLRSKFERLKKFWKLDHSNFSDVAGDADGYTSVKIIDKFTKSAIDETDERTGLVEDDVILLRDASGAGRSTAEKLASVEPRLVLKNGGISEVADEVLFENRIPVGDADDVKVREVDDLAIGLESDVEDVIEDWEERAEERKRKRSSEMVDSLITEYRAERKRETSD